MDSLWILWVPEEINTGFTGETNAPSAMVEPLIVQ